MPRRLLVFALFVIGLLVSTIASAATTAYAGTRVGAFDLAEHVGVGLSVDQAAEKHRATRFTCDEIASGSPHAAGSVVDPAKFRYLFGEAGGNAHNVARTAQNAGQMARVGVYNTAEGRALLQSHFESVVTNPARLHAGAVTFVQRFGSSLNLQVHRHTCALDGVYVEGDAEEALRFVPASSPSPAELTALTERVALRVMTWLRKRGYVKDDEHASNEAPERSFAEQLAQLAMQRGTVENVKDDTAETEGPAEPAGPLRDDAVTRHGFNLHGSVTIAADDDLGRERL